MIEKFTFIFDLFSDRLRLGSLAVPRAHDDHGRPAPPNQLCGQLIFDLCSLISEDYEINLFFLMLLVEHNRQYLIVNLWKSVF